MENSKLQDIEYMAFRFAGGVTYKALRDLFELGIINSHRDLSISGISDIQQRIKNTDNHKLYSFLKTLNSKLDSVKLEVDKYIHLMELNNIDVISCEDELYPESWKVLAGMPLVFFTKGDNRLLDRCNKHGAVSVVGTRIPSNYSIKATREIVSQIVDKNIVIISGGALGIDRVAHETALNSSGDTILVAPCGLNYCYPYQNRDVYESLYSNGLVVSEMPPGQKPLKQYFPARNRLIAGLADVCLVMEAGVNSGTLHTASFAASQGKEVFVLPENLYMPNALGGLNLIRDGASILIDSADVIDAVATCVFYRIHENILEEYSNSQSEIITIRNKMKKSPDELSDDEWKLIVCDELRDSNKSIDELAINIGLSFTALSYYVSELELSGIIESNDGKYALTFIQ